MNHMGTVYSVYKKECLTHFQENERKKTNVL